MAVIRPTTTISRDASPLEDAPAPVSRVVDDILRRALADGASDVHIEPLSDGSGHVRYRVDGVVSDLPAFGEAFSCKEGAPMRPAKVCAVW